MSFFLRSLTIGFLLFCTLTGCSTPQRRAREHSSAFRRLSPSDRALVLRGRVRPGLSQAGVYIAWGEPDEKVTGGFDKNGPNVETWIYRQQVTINEPQNSYDYYGPYQGIDPAPVAPSLWPGYGIGGIGNEALIRFQPHVRHLDTLRIAEFKRDELERFKTAEDNWTSRLGTEVKASAFHHPLSSNASAHTHNRSATLNSLHERRHSKQPVVRRDAKRRFTVPHHPGKAIVR